MSKQWFKCPDCGGILVRLIPARTKEDCRMVEIASGPMCKTCKKSYVINIATDLSYEIVEEELNAKFMPM